MVAKLLILWRNLFSPDLEKTQPAFPLWQPHYGRKAFIQLDGNNCFAIKILTKLSATTAFTYSALVQHFLSTISKLVCEQDREHISRLCAPKQTIIAENTLYIVLYSLLHYSVSCEVIDSIKASALQKVFVSFHVAFDK